eukprot:TRINITY_DN7627_c0_g1_i1.p1 TRINITY_DN7627_c0_g1~~TRINITY_DN7627_c0_g1_i1.p1  ORF type:complete len:566 (+),score=131.57 TRINITY_DN7627_c0_g1_i1:140-1837(+)
MTGSRRNSRRKSKEVMDDDLEPEMMNYAYRRNQNYLVLANPIKSTLPASIRRKTKAGHTLIRYMSLDRTSKAIYDFVKPTTLSPAATLLQDMSESEFQQHIAHVKLQYRETWIKYRDELKLGESDEEYTIEKLLDRKKIGRKLVYLVKWMDWGDEYNTWEPRAMLMECCSQLVADFDKRFKQQIAVNQDGSPASSPRKRTSPSKSFAAVFKSNKRARAKRTGTGKRSYFTATARLQVDNLCETKRPKPGLELMAGLVSPSQLPHLGGYNFLVDVILNGDSSMDASTIATATLDKLLTLHAPSATQLAWVPGCGEHDWLIIDRAIDLAACSDNHNLRHRGLTVLRYCSQVLQDSLLTPDGHQIVSELLQLHASGERQAIRHLVLRYRDVVEQHASLAVAAMTSLFQPIFDARDEQGQHTTAHLFAEALSEVTNTKHRAVFINTLQQPLLGCVAAAVLHKTCNVPKAGRTWKEQPLSMDALLQCYFQMRPSSKSADAVCEFLTLLHHTFAAVKAEVEILTHVARDSLVEAIDTIASSLPKTLKRSGKVAVRIQLLKSVVKLAPVMQA